MLTIKLEDCGNEWLAFIEGCDDSRSCVYGHTAEEAIAKLSLNLAELRADGVIIGDSLYKYDRASAYEVLIDEMRRLGLKSKDFRDEAAAVTLDWLARNTPKSLAEECARIEQYAASAAAHEEAH